MHGNGTLNQQNVDFELHVATGVLENLDNFGQHPNEEEKHEKPVQSESDGSEHGGYLAKFLSNDPDEGL